MLRLITALILATLLTSCSTTGVCPQYPPMPQQVKDILYPHLENQVVFHWANDQVRLKKKLEQCQ